MNIKSILTLITLVLLIACDSTSNIPNVTTTYYINLSDIPEFDSAVVSVTVDGNEVTHFRHSTLDLDEDHWLGFDISATENSSIKVACLIWKDGNPTAVSRGRFISGDQPAVASLQFLAHVEIASPLQLGPARTAALSATTTFPTGVPQTLGIDSALWDTNGDGSWDTSETWAVYFFDKVVTFPESDADTLHAAFGMRYVDGTLTTHTFTILVGSGSDTFLDPRDSTEYPMVTIGSQTWFAKNLDYRPSESLDSGIWCYDDQISNCQVHGALYDQSHALTACPDGSHLPSKDEVNTLISFIGGTEQAGKIIYPDPDIAPYASNSTGLSILFGGMVIMGQFSAFEIGAFFWGSDIDSGGDGYYWTPYTANLMNPIAGLSVRCLLD